MHIFSTSLHSVLQESHYQIINLVENHVEKKVLYMILYMKSSCKICPVKVDSYEFKYRFSLLERSSVLTYKEMNHSIVERALPPNALSIFSLITDNSIYFLPFNCFVLYSQNNIVQL